MKYLVSLMLLVACANLASAQSITFTADEYFAGFGQSANNQTSFSTTDISGLDALIAKTGPNMTWDFSGRIYTQDPAPTGTSTILTYPGGAPLANDPDFVTSTHVLKSVPNDPTQPIEYIFMKFNSNGLWVVGASQDSLGMTKKVAAYVPPLQQLAFPLTYQTAWQSTSDFRITGLPTGAYTMSVDAIADAYGTLVTPSSIHQKNGPTPMASSDALRVKTKNTNTISLFSFSQTTVDYGFDWYTKTGHSASISADTNVAPTGASYAVQGSSSVSDKYFSPENYLNLYLTANPASTSETRLYFTLKNGGNAQVSMMDVLGNEVHRLHDGPAVSGQNLIPIDPTKFAAGTYLIRVQAEGMTATRKLIITK
ncbi:MAG: T9SS type A sorting domain-containing protein [Bacteroidota bacterium]|nr:T9SS type A sorting domain-containing protein [Bacteroidota bacterium]MDP4235378.1 T9SS type A sorting domain-containing protein [Bacteroidota bacterium]